MLRNTDVSQVKPEPYSVCFILVISLIVFFFFFYQRRRICHALCAHFYIHCVCTCGSLRDQQWEQITAFRILKCICIREHMGRLLLYIYRGFSPYRCVDFSLTFSYHLIFRPNKLFDSDNIIMYMSVKIQLSHPGSKMSNYM